MVCYILTLASIAVFAALLIQIIHIGQRNSQNCRFLRQPQIYFHHRKINKCFPKFVSFVHAHINPLDIEIFDVTLTCMICNL